MKNSKIILLDFHINKGIEAFAIEDVILEKKEYDTIEWNIKKEPAFTIQREKN